jgi:hypothetical protein
MNRRQFVKFAGCACLAAEARPRRTEVRIEGQQFFINGKRTYAGRYWRGWKIEGLLMNSRMVQGIFDDLNPATRSRWVYPDTGRWDPERNTREFIEAMPSWRAHGLLSFTINLQGGSPEGYSKQQPWHNSAIEADGSLRPDYMSRLKRILDRADELGMVPIVGIFYFGQDQRVKDEDAVRQAVINATRWLLEQGYRNVLLEINNECDVRAYDHEILKPARVHELIELARSIRVGGRRLPVGTSYAGGDRASPQRGGGFRFPAHARQRRPRSPANRGNGPRGASSRRLPSHAHPVQRGRPLRLRQAFEQHDRRYLRVRVVGLFRPRQE